MAWAYLFLLAIVVWGLCGGVVAVGRMLWPMDTVLLVHMILAPVFAFGGAAVHRRAAPAFDPLLRAVVITAVAILLDAAVVAPLVERSYAMFTSIVGTWIPFGLMFLAAWTAGRLGQGLSGRRA